MFKPGQVIRSKLSGNLALVQMVDYNKLMCRLYVLSGPSTGETLWPFPVVDPESEVIGNNYRNIRPKEPEQRGCRKEDC